MISIHFKNTDTHGRVFPMASGYVVVLRDASYIIDAPQCLVGATIDQEMAPLRTMLSKLEHMKNLLAVK